MISYIFSSCFKMFCAFKSCVDRMRINRWCFVDGRCWELKKVIWVQSGRKNPQKKGLISLPSLKLTFFLHLKKWMVGISEYQFSFWDGKFFRGYVSLGTVLHLKPLKFGDKKGPMIPAILSWHRFNWIINLAGLQGAEYPPFPNIAKKVQKFIKSSSYQGHIGAM